MHLRLGLLSLLASVSFARNLHNNNLLHRRDDSTTSSARGSISAVPPNVVTLTGHSTASATDLAPVDDTTVLTTVVNGHTTRVTLIPTAAASSDGIVILTGTGKTASATTVTESASRNGTTSHMTMQTSTSRALTTTERAAVTDSSASQTESAAASSTAAAVPAATAALGWAGLIGVGAGAMMGLL
ncbi:Aldehyde dehydrogenase [Lasiodiplodia theobromae]|uniref:Aldehyde dehydrogenase n=1 Tax=Lasiodiplodia theobromae TaxID=45133 RepID=UPI0015C35746|nr:Aldehyde dehydrogenase [Lasiodiplodia theobromae]KAF4538438.1 Aldehyde dehydrogenase [Lasiodiplodia theobromae]